MRRALVPILVVLIAAGLPCPSRAGDDWLRYRGEVREEVTATAPDDSPLNPGGRILGGDEMANRIRLGAELALKLGPRWTVKAKGAADARVGRDRRLQTAHVESDLALRDLYVNGSFGRFQLSAGRKILKWSNGYAFSPAGLLDPVRDPSDPRDRLGRTEGRDLVQLDYYAGAHTLSLVASAPGRFWSGPVSQETIVALRYHVVLDSLELAASAGWRPTAKDVAALSFSYTVGDRIGLHGEVAGSRGTDALFPRSILPGKERTLFGRDFLAPLRQAERALCLRGLLGVNYTFTNGLNLIAEVYHSDEGLGATEWSRFMAQADYSRALFEGGSFPPVAEGRSIPEVNLLQAMQVLRQGSVRRNYSFLRAARTFSGGKLQVEALGILGLDDRSFVVVPEVAFAVTPRILTYVRGTAFGGSRRSEFGSLPSGPFGSVGAVVSF